ncbi:MAG: divalent cation transporter [Acidimicrobiia bacterium]|nr:MAG: divalent cation transporter [Acidimicrobiia bacterium]
MRPPRRVGARFVALLRADPNGVRAGFVALLISTATGLVAGITLGSITGTLEELPGLVILVPAAVGMRGNVFGALGSRIGTSVHAGTFRLGWRIDTEVGQNLASAVVLSMALAFGLAVVAKGFSIAFGVEGALSLADFVVVSVVGGIIPIAVVMAITLAVAALSVRYDWDLDNVAAPVVTAAADTVTLPSLFLATALVGVAGVTPVLALAGAALGVGLLVAAWRSRLPILRRVVRESVPVLLFAGFVSMLAGLTIQGRLGPLVRQPELLVVVPPLLSLAGSLAGILASRLATKLHLGLVEARRGLWRGISEDLALVYFLAVTIFVVLASVTELIAAALSLDGPGFGTILGVVVLAGLIATTLSNFVAYAGALSTFRFGLDPDNLGIPLVSSASDLLGSASLILCLVIFGLT